MTTTNRSLPVLVQARVSLEQHAAIASIAAENEITESEAMRLLIDTGYADLKRRMGQALRDHAADVDELAQGETPERAAAGRHLGDQVRIGEPTVEVEW